MNNNTIYPQRIHVPTTVPVQQYFANPYVFLNKFGAGDVIDRTSPSAEILGVDANDNPVGSPSGSLFGIDAKGDKIASGVLGKLGINSGSNPLTGLKGGLLSAAGTAINRGALKLGTGNFDKGVGFGNAVAGVGNMAGKVLGYIPGVGKLAGPLVQAATGIIGGLANRIGGYHLNTATINAINGDIHGMNNLRVSDSSNQSIANQAAAQNWGSTFGLKDIGNWGWASKGKVESKFNDLQRGMASAQNYAAANYDNAATNVTKNMMDNLLMNYGAYGGLFDTSFNPLRQGSDAIAYTLEQQKLANQQQMLGMMQSQMQPQQSIQRPYGFGGCIPFCSGGRLFANGGSTHGSDFTNGMIHIDAGGTHEENPNQGVQLGSDRNGVPNVLEEGEVVFNNYVFSNRLNIPDDVAEKLRIPKGKTFAQGGKLLAKESDERPNDPMSLGTLDWATTILRTAQEAVKEEKERAEQAEAINQFRQLPVDEQAAVLQGLQQDEQTQATQLQGLPQWGLPVQQPGMAFGGNLFGNGGYFRVPVNMFAEGDSLDDLLHSTINYTGDYDRNSAWDYILGDALIDELSRNLDGSESVDDFIKRYNDIQDAYYNAFRKNGYDFSGSVKKNSDVLLAQTLFNNAGLNSLFDRNGIDLSKVYTGSKGMTTDNMQFHNPDAVPGAKSDIRYLGDKNMRRETREKFDSILKKYGLEAYVDDNADGLLKVRKVGADTSSKAEDDGTKTSISTDAMLGNKGAMSGLSLDTEYQGQEDKKYLPTWMRYAPIVASGLATFTDMLGLTNKPDFSDAQGLLEASREAGRYMPTSFRPIPNKDLYNPFDLDYYVNQARAEVESGRRALQDNSNGNQALNNASQVAATRGAITALGDARMKAGDVNAQRKAQDAKINTGIDQFNSSGTFEADKTNAVLFNRASRSKFAGLAAYYEARQKEKAAAAAARSANLSNFVKSLAGIGRENFILNQINDNSALLYGANPNGGSYYKGAAPATQEEKKRIAVPSLATAPLLGGVPNFLQPIQWNPYWGAKFNV